MRKHGLRKTKLYSVWSMMKQRCYNTNNKDYKDYGARRIVVCNEWKSDVASFYYWATTNGYKEGLTIDRIDANGNYEPNNCRWVTIREQANNKRNTIFVKIDDCTYTLSELSKLYNIRRETLEMRYARGDKGNRLVRPAKTIIA